MSQFVSSLDEAVFFMLLFSTSWAFCSVIGEALLVEDSRLCEANQSISEE